MMDHSSFQSLNLTSSSSVIILKHENYTSAICHMTVLQNRVLCAKEGLYPNG